MTVTSNEDVAAKVRGAAAEKRVTSAAIAERLSLSAMAVSRRMGGQTPWAPEELIKVASLLRVPVSRFFGEDALASGVAS